MERGVLRHYRWLVVFGVLFSLQPHSLSQISIPGFSSDAEITQGPEISSTQLAPEDLPQDLSLSVGLKSDNAISSVQFALNSLSGESLGPATLSLSSGSPSDGIWSGNLTVPDGSTAGTYEASLIVLSGLANVSLIDSDASVTIGMSSSASPIVLDSLTLDPPRLPEGTDPVQVQVRVALSHEPGAVVSVQFQASTQSGLPVGEVELQQSDSSPSGTQWEGTWEFLPSLLQFITNEPVVFPRLIVENASGSTQVIDPEIRYEPGSEGVRTTFEVSLIEAIDLQWFQASLIPGITEGSTAYIRILDGPNQGNYPLQPTLQADAWKASVAVEEGQTISWIPLIDLNGDGIDTGDWLPGDRDATNPFTHEIGSQPNSPLSGMFTSKAPRFFPNEALALSGSALLPNQPGFTSFNNEDTDTFWDFSLLPDADTRFLTVIRHNTDDYGPPLPNGIAKKLQGTVWELVQSREAGAQTALTGRLDLERLPPNPNPDALRFIVAETFDGPWSVVTPRYDAATGILEKEFADSTRWVGLVSTDAANTLEFKLPSAARQPFPADQSLNIATDATLSWQSDDTESWKLFIWKEGEPTPEFPEAESASVPRLALENAGEIEAGTSYRWKVQTLNASGSTESPVWRFTTAQLPDLAIEGIQTTSAAIAGQSLDVSWGLRNLGGPLNLDTPLQFAVYLSPTTLASEGQRIALVPYSGGALAAGASTIQSTRVSIPRVQPGIWNLIVEADPFESLDESNRVNNLGIQPLPFSNNLTPDLAVSTVFAPPILVSGQAVEVQVDISNTGEGPSGNEFLAIPIYLSDSEVFDPDESSLVQTMALLNSIPSGESQTLSASFWIPGELAGTFYIFAQVDPENTSFDPNPNNNVRRSDAIQILSPAPIDLEPTTFTTTSTEVSAGSVTEATWTVVNRGPGVDTFRGWVDAIYLSEDSSFDAQNDILLTEQASWALPAVDDSYTQTAVFRIPEGLEGTWQLILVVDDKDDLPEASFEENNVLSLGTSFNVTPGSYPNLAVTSLDFPVTLTEGTPASLRWTVANTGTGVASPTWQESIYVSENFPTAAEAIAANDWRRVDQQSVRTAIPAGQTLARSLNLEANRQLPDSGYLFLVLDETNQVFEFDEESDNISAGSAFLFQAHPGSDLAATWQTEPVFSAEKRSIRIQWQIRNLGAATLGDRWTESVYLSADDQFDFQGDFPLAEYPRVRSVGMNETLDRSIELLVPGSWTSPFYLIVVVDPTEDLNDRERSNNVLISSAQFEASTEARPALTFVSAEASTPNSLSELHLEWMIENTGGAILEQEEWIDTWLLSTDPFADALDIVLLRTAQQGPLLPGEQSAGSADVPFPNLFSGDVYILGITDENNALHPSSSLPARTWAQRFSLPDTQATDLALRNVQLQTAVIEAGTPIVLSGSIQNLGQEAIQTLVTGVAYLSDDPDGRSRDRVLGQVNQFLNLEAGAEVPLMNLQGTSSWRVPAPALTEGEKPLFVALDLDPWTNDTDLANNIFEIDPPLSIQIPTVTPGVSEDVELQVNRSHYFRWDQVEEADSLSIEITSLPADGIIQANLFLDAPGSQGNAVDSQAILAGDNLTLRIEPTDVGTYYLEVKYSGAAPEGSTGLPATILIEPRSFSVDRLLPSSGGNAGMVTLAIEGAAFRMPMSAHLIQGETQIVASKIWPPVDGVVYARFDLRDAPQGLYDLQLTRTEHIYGIELIGDEIDFGSRTVEQHASLSSAFTIETADLREVELDLTIPSVISPDSDFTVTIEASNPGNQDVEAPLTYLFGEPGFWKRRAGGTGYQAGSLLVQLTSNDGPLGTLRPQTTTRHQITGRFVAPPAPGRELGIGVVPVEDSGIPFEPSDWVIAIDSDDPRDDSIRRELLGELRTWSDFQSLLAKQINRLDFGRQLEEFANEPLDLVNAAIQQRLSALGEPASDDNLALQPNRQGLQLAQSRTAFKRLNDEVDTDGDGLYDSTERELGTDPERADSDRDGIPDGDEVHLDLDPKNRADGNADLDGDGLENFDEYKQGTDPRNADSDGDGETDKEEFCGPLTIQKNRGVLNSVAAAFVTVSGRLDSTANQHLRHFLNGDGSEITYGPKSRVASDMRRHSSATTPYLSSVIYASKVAKTQMDGVLKGINWENPPTRIPDMSLTQPLRDTLKHNHNELMKPNFYITDKTDFVAPYAFDLAMGFGGTQKIDTRLSIKRVYLIQAPTCEQSGLAWWEGTLHFKISDHYEFDKQDANIGPIDAAGRQLQVCGSAKPFWVHVNMEDIVQANVVLPPLNGPRCEPDDEPKPRKPWTFPYKIAQIPTSLDPNDILGPEGVGEDRFVARDKRLDYRIRFENDPELATAPAQRVTIEFPVDPDLDIRTFEFGGIGFANESWQQSAGTISIDQTVPSSVDPNLQVRIFGALDIPNERVIWSFESIDTQSKRPPQSPLRGFLPVNNEDHDGEGYVTFSVRPKQDAPTGTRIDAEAAIIFDANPALQTPPIFNTLDAVSPTTEVSTDLTRLPGQLELTWQATDDEGGSGVRHYDVLVSNGNKPWSSLLSATQDTSLILPINEAQGSRYQVLAVDAVGNREPSLPANIQAPFANDSKSRYQDWASQFLPETLSRFDLDADGDGRSNGEEYYQGTNPSELDSPSPIEWTATVTPEGTRTELRLFRHTQAAAIDLRFEASTDLETWTEIAPSDQILSESPEAELEVIQFLFAPQTAETAFLRYQMITP